MGYMRKSVTALVRQGMILRMTVCILLSTSALIMMLFIITNLILLLS